ncbi:unnamed protein product (macronuclear) [Paramecium tetraurelia]|uniref:Probable protein phosphatase 2C 5 n=1 Tax=Paramecium tetraurelia TaxID=5888 RepID=PP2C5_PARTE|nr:uncharacterized protein GSPATT00010582001 [Paramecium tetraurelia]A0CUB5.1 RecName: Full=Probable protein phosphatase 2C 5; Short=PP2C 5 [Paramecium tetraurelia]CAK74382.1 unnamed protein product [Paramecium tetraurelia]|eukprot:XP_001441779.1 hypothetical protein (macronuclear) [Paramecium tetraurelia strain d4-2]
MGPYLSQPKTEKSTVTGQNQVFQYAATHMQGWRNTMEDAHISDMNIEPDVHLFAVFDGHGGSEVAIFAERHFREELMKNKNYQQKNYEKALTETFFKIDKMLQEPSGQDELNKIRGVNDETSLAGCTANVALIVGKTLYVANAGDSRSFLNRDGKPFDMSKDHKPDDDQEKKRIERAGGFVSDGRANGNLSLSRALGDLEYKKDSRFKPEEQIISALPDVKVTQLTASDKFLLMGCDGVFETWDHQQILNFVNQELKSSQNLQKATEKLLDQLLAKDTSLGTGCDNMTCILVLFK